ncbi:hypothetical protein VTN77DRAFT_825 [Rasamsonia byssochlamydoides]|uniref:uncharacterized protein n=1 Tax=Rasamsonia byssochlamydoides TaxID=89139 RepID=UPI003743A905
MAKRLRRDSSSSLSDLSVEAQPTSSSRATPAVTPPPAKVTTLDEVDRPAQVMRCSLPPHREALTFSSYEEYEVHYLQTHVNRCSECGKNFPTHHFLNLHIEENHDPLIATRRERGEKTYSCFVEGCERKCSTPQKRRRHLIDKHMFPRTYNFFIVNDGIDKHHSMLRSPNGQRRRVSTTQSHHREGRLRNRKTSLSSSTADAERRDAASYGHDDGHARTDTSSVMDIDDLTKSMSALRFVPTSVMKKLDGRNQGK